MEVGTFIKILNILAFVNTVNGKPKQYEDGYDLELPENFHRYSYTRSEDNPISSGRRGEFANNYKPLLKTTKRNPEEIIRERRNLNQDFQLEFHPRAPIRVPGINPELPPPPNFLDAVQENHYLRRLLMDNNKNFEIIYKKFQKVEQDMTFANKTIDANQVETKEKIEMETKSREEAIGNTNLKMENDISEANKLISANYAEIKEQLKVAKDEEKEEFRIVGEKIDVVNSKVGLVKDRILENESKTEEDIKNLVAQLANLNTKVDEQVANLIGLINNLKQLVTNPVTDAQGIPIAQ